jgi:hypothetical protein
MPLYHFAHADAPERVELLEEAGEKLVGVAADESGVYVATATAHVKAARAKAGDETR